MQSSKMAVPYYVPEHDNRGNRGASASGSNSGSAMASGSSTANSSVNHSPNMTTSSTQTPIQSPVSNEHLVQALYEALCRCSMNNNGSPVFCFPPPSPSCSSSSPASFHGGDVFFPRGRSTPRSPRLHYNEDGAFFRNPRSNRSSGDFTRRSRLMSSGDIDDECHSEHETSWDELDDRYENYMATRDRLQEFPGRIPPRKKKKDTTKTKPKTKENPSFTWPTVVTVFVFAVGCGFLASR